MTNSQCSARENASKQILAKLQRIGLSDAHIRHEERCAINAFTHNKGSVNVDFAVQGGTAVKICMYVHRDGLVPNIQADLLSVGRKYKGWILELGKMGPQRTEAGVLYKLNTHVNWINIASEDVTTIANTVKDFVCDVSRVLK